jgi:hypothetical protein
MSGLLESWRRQVALVSRPVAEAARKVVNLDREVMHCVEGRDHKAEQRVHGRKTGPHHTVLEPAEVVEGPYNPLLIFAAFSRVTSLQFIDLTLRGWDLVILRRADSHMKGR